MLLGSRSETINNKNSSLGFSETAASIGTAVDTGAFRVTVVVSL